MAAGRGSTGGRRPKRTTRPAKPGGKAGAGKTKAGTAGTGRPGGKSGTKDANAPRPSRRGSAPNAADAPRDAAAPAGPFRLGAVPGTTPGKWIDTWRERTPDIAIELVPIAVATQRASLTDAAAADGAPIDAALVRLPIDRDGLHVIALYDEKPVVVCAADSHLTAADELTLDDLAGEVVIVPGDAVHTLDVPGAVPPRFAAPATTGEAIATVAAGVGVVIVPMSLARLHQRKDAEVRALVDGPTSTVALAWPASDSSPLVDTFVGIVRGRTAHSSRS